jgi:hypothetical protein
VTFSDVDSKSLLTRSPILFEMVIYGSFGWTTMILKSCLQTQFALRVRTGWFI